MNTTMPLYRALVQHRDLRRASLHTPGHKNRALPADLLSLDFTELPDTDSLFEASGAILQAEQEAARVLGTAHTFFSAGGCTLCIQAMLRLASQRGGRRVLAHRVLHRSAVHAMALLDLEPVWLYPTPDAGAGLAGRVSPQTVERALEQAPDAACVYVTSPDYFGVRSDIAGIAEVCRRYDVPLLVDNAHGAHLGLTSAPHPIHDGAAMTACSAHKTLPVLTGGAWLNLADDRFAQGARDAMALFGSTSPSYPVMASLDWCAHWMEHEGREAYRRLEQQVEQLGKRALARGFGLPKGAVDPTRLSLNTALLGQTGEQAAEHFRRCGVEPEYADGAYVVLIATPWNTPEEFGRIAHALDTMPVGSPLPLESPALPSPPPRRVSLREALFAPAVEVPLAQAVGRVAAQAACPCPPGVPVVMPGEEVTAQAAEFLHRYGFFTAGVLQ